ncbi:MAG: hypothetical protein ACKVVP_08485 [Chloroflexota bacterium]
MLASLAASGLAKLFQTSPAEAGHSTNDGILNLRQNNTNGNGMTSQFSSAGGGTDGA